MRNKESIEKARLDLEQDIEQHSQIVIDRKRKLNSLADIARLPPEIFSEIFMCYKQYYCVPRSPAPAIYAGCLIVAQVCHLWREIALSTPRFWSYITTIRSLELLQVLLARSKQAPLDIDFQMPRVNISPEIYRLTFAHSNRFQTLNLSLLLHQYAEFNLNSILPDDAPNLRSLRLSNYEASTSLPKAFDKVSATGLEELELFGYVVPQTSSLLSPTLTSLKITSDERTSQQPSVFGMIKVLQSLPCLRNLFLIRTMEPLVVSTAENPAPSLPPTSDRVALPCLQSLFLSDDAMTAVYLLSHLAIPSTTPVDIVLRGLSTDAMVKLAVTPIADFLSQPNRDTDSSTSVSPIKTLALIAQPPGSYGLSELLLECYTDSIPLKETSGRDSFLHRGQLKPRFSIRFQTSASPAQFNRLMNLFISALPIADVQGLSTGKIPFDSLNKAAWLHLMERLPNLKEMRVQACNALELPKFLGTRIECAPAAQPQDPEKKPTRRKLQPILPLLETLQFQAIKFKDYPTATSTMVNQLVQLFKNRSSAKGKKKRGAPAALTNLDIELCMNIFQQDIDALKEVAENVTWDNDVLVMDPDYSDEESDFDGLGPLDYDVDMLDDLDDDDDEDDDGDDFGWFPPIFWG